MRFKSQEEEEGEGREGGVGGGAVSPFTQGLCQREHLASTAAKLSAVPLSAAVPALLLLGVGILALPCKSQSALTALSHL